MEQAYLSLAFTLILLYEFYLQPAGTAVVHPCFFKEVGKCTIFRSFETARATSARTHHSGFNRTMYRVRQ